MKFKEVIPKKNRLVLNITLPALVIVCILWIILKEYIRFAIYLLFTIICFHMFLQTYYYLRKDYICVKSGFLKIKLYYKNIKEVVDSEDKLIIKHNNINWTFYPDDKKSFVKELKSKVSKKVSFMKEG